MARLDDPVYWEDRVFCMVSPDCLRRHLAMDLLARLAGAGMRPVGWRLAPITPESVDRMSEIQNLSAAGAYRYRALDALFALGPAMMLIMADTKGRAPEQLYADAKRAKGDADPLRAEPGTIRGDLRPINVVLNLIHLSDSPKQSALECPILGGLESDEFVAGDPAAVIKMFEAGHARETRGFVAVLSNLRARLLVRLWPHLPPQACTLALAAIDRDELGCADAGEQLATLAGHEPFSGLGPLLEVLAAPFDGSAERLDLPTVERLLACHDILLDPWERAVLTTSGYFRPAW